MHLALWWHDQWASMKDEIMGIRVQWMHAVVLVLGLEGVCSQCVLQVIEDEQSQK